MILKKVLSVAAGFVVATVLPWALGVALSSSLVIGGATAEPQREGCKPG